MIYELHEKSESSSDSDDEFESVPVDDEAPAEGPAPPSILLPARPKLPPAQPPASRASQAAKASQAVPRRPAPAEPKAKPPAKVAGDGWSLPATKTEAADAAGPKMSSVFTLRKRWEKSIRCVPAAFQAASSSSRPAPGIRRRLEALKVPTVTLQSADRALRFLGKLCFIIICSIISCCSVFTLSLSMLWGNIFLNMFSLSNIVGAKGGYPRPTAPHGFGGCCPCRGTATPLPGICQQHSDEACPGCCARGL